MTLRRLFVFFLSAVGTGVLIRLRPWMPTMPAPSWADDEAAIRQQLDASAEAWNRGDLEGHVAIYDENVTMMTAEGPRPTVAAIAEAFCATSFRDGSPPQALHLEQVAVRPLGRDAALATGRYHLSGGSLPDQAGWFTLVWLRTPTGWRAVHDHTH